MPDDAPELGLTAAGFGPATQAWFEAAFAQPTPAQAQAWESIGRGQHTLVIAPTGSGKTLAAFLWAIDKLAREPAPADRKQRCRVLYVSPMKALAVDVQRNLRSPLTGIGHAARRLGLAEPDIQVAVRTGDTAADERRKMASKPPDILITTPESLFLLLTSQARETLRSVETVIIDEVHAMAGGKRGAHLALSLERLDALRDAPVQRIGLSATVRPPEEVASFLGGALPVSVVAPPSEKQLALTIVVPVEDMTDLQSADPGADPAAAGPRQHSIWPHVEERVLDLIQAHRSTIVFANSRGLAERLCARLNELAAERAEEQAPEMEQMTAQMPAQMMAQSPVGAGVAPVVARAHHGSVSRQERTQIEEALKAGRLPAVVATSSLELGIDMGAVDLVIQVESPPSVASGLQRTGRAGHNVGDVSRGVFFPKYPGDLVQAAVVTQRMHAGEIEQLRMPRNPLDVLAQQIVAMTAMDDWDVSELERVVRRAAPFSGLTRPVLDSVLDMLAGLYPSEDFGGLRPRLVWDRAAGVLHGRPGGQRVAVGNGGTIPDRGLFGVFLAGGARDRSGRHARRVGELDEEMVYESRVGDVFVLGASSWRIEDITADQVLVSPAPGQPGKLPFWHGDTIGRPAELGAAIGAYCRELGAEPEADATARLRAGGLDELAARNLISYLSSQREATGYLPDDRTLVVERFRDELGDWRVVLHSPYGAQVHAPWALAIATRLRERYGGMDVQAIHTDDGIIIRVPDTDDPPPASIALLDPDEVEQLVTSELTSSALFASRFRECAARALLLPRRQPGRRTPLWQQRQRAAQLLSVASQYATFPIVLETVRECLQDVFDVPGLTALMRDLTARRIRLVEVETPTASPFARSLLFRYVGAFMYEGDAPLAERRAQALALDSALLADLLGQANMRELLDPVVVEEVERELQRLAPGRACRDAEAVADMLRTLGPLTVAEVAQRSADPVAAPGWLAELAAQRRVLELRVGGEARWAAVEDAGRLRDALGAALPPGVPGAFTEPGDDPLRDLIVRYARTHGPFTALEAAQRYGLGVAVVSGTLHRLAAAGSVSEGEFRASGRGTEWCESGVLRTLRRRCLAKLRKEVEPVPPRAFGAFLPAWQGAGRLDRPGGRGGGAARNGPGGLDAVYEAVDQLAGVAVPASALETLVLPGRVPGYSPALLDELTAAGEVAWAGAGGLPGGDGWVVLAPAESAPALLPEPAEITMTLVHDAVLEVLAGGGALFFRGLADRVGAALAVAAGSGGMASDQALASAIWDLVWAGRLTNDTLAPLRTVLSSGRPVTPGDARRRAAAAAAGVAAARRGARGPGRRRAAAAVRGAPRAGRRAAAGLRARGPAVARRAAHGQRALVAAGAAGAGPDPAAARDGHLAAGAVRHRAARRRGGRAGAGRVQRDLPGAAGHGGRRAVPARVLRGRAGRGAVRAAGRRGPDAGAGRDAGRGRGGRGRSRAGATAGGAGLERASAPGQRPRVGGPAARRPGAGGIPAGRAAGAGAGGRGPGQRLRRGPAVAGAAGGDGGRAPAGAQGRGAGRADAR